MASLGLARCRLTSQSSRTFQNVSISSTRISKISSSKLSVNHRNSCPVRSVFTEMNTPEQVYHFTKKFVEKYNLQALSPQDAIRFSNHLNQVVDLDRFNQEIITKFNGLEETDFIHNYQLSRKSDAQFLYDYHSFQYSKQMKDRAKLKILTEISENLREGKEISPDHLFESQEISSEFRGLSDEEIAREYRVLTQEKKRLNENGGDLTAIQKEEEDLIDRIVFQEKCRMQKEFQESLVEKRNFLERVKEAVEEAKRLRKLRKDEENAVTGGISFATNKKRQGYEEELTFADSEEAEGEEDALNMDDEEQRLRREGNEFISQYENDAFDPKANMKFLQKVRSEIISSYVQEHGLNSFSVLQKQPGLSKETIESSLEGDQMLPFYKASVSNLKDKEQLVQLVEEMQRESNADFGVDMSEPNWDLERQTQLRNKQKEILESVQNKKIQEEREERERKRILSVERSRQEREEGEGDEEDFRRFGEEGEEGEGDEEHYPTERAPKKDDGEESSLLYDEEEPFERPVFSFQDTDYRLPMNEIEKVLPEGLSGNFNKFSQENYEEGEPVLVNDTPFKEVRNKLENAKEQKFCFMQSEDSTILLDGPTGTGKSVTISQIVYWARTNGWIVAYLPDALNFINGADYIEPSKSQSGMYDQPSIARKFAQNMLKAHEAQLSKVPIKSSFQIEGFQGKNLADLLKFAKVKENDTWASEAVYRFRLELNLVSEYPVLIAIDGINIYWKHSNFGDSQAFKKTTFDRLYPNKLVLCNSFMNIEGHGLTNGVVVAGTTAIASDKAFKKEISPTVLKNSTITKNWDYEQTSNMVDVYIRHNQITKDVPEANRKYLFSITNGNPKEVTQYTAVW